MDLGVFKRGRMGLWVWLAGPLALLLVAGALSLVCSRRTERELRWRKAVAAVLPDMYRQLAAADEVLDVFGERVSDEGEAVKRLRTELNRIASDSGFVINSLSIEAPGGFGGGLPSVNADVKGEGRLTAITDLFRHLQKPGGLVRVESLRIGVKKAGPQPDYKAQFVLRWCFLGANATAEGEPQ